jgi:2-polyprenyl-3-methyl-5-hydroxy-6-metoxy-1,4-benzoquinol methylase
MEGTKLDFPDGSFDVVGSFQVIEHIPEPQLPTYLTEIRRVLSAEGVCCLSTLNLEHNTKPGQPYQKLCYHEKEFTAQELRELLERFFPSVELHGLYLRPKHRLYQRLKKWGLNRIGSARLNPVARFYDSMSVDAFQTRRGVSRAALDLIAVCRKTAPLP